METPLYQIVDWNEHFENFKSRKVDMCRYVCVPNKPGGLGFKNVLGEGDGPAIYGIWMLIVQLCSRQRKKREGWLTEDGKRDGRPLSLMELSRAFGRPLDEIVRAFEVLTARQVGWIKLVKGVAEFQTVRDEVSAEYPPGIPEVSARYPRSIPEVSPKYPLTIPRISSANHVKPDIPQLGPYDGVNGIRGPSSEQSSNSHRAGIEQVKKEGVQSTTLHSITVPTTTPPETAKIREGDFKKIEEEDKAEFNKALAWFNSLFPNSEAWSYEELKLLSELLPIKPESQEVISWAHKLPTDHRFHDLTKLKQSRLALLREFGAEVDKIRSVRKQLGLNNDPKPIIKITA